MITKIISGGQSGSDRAALEFAHLYNIQHGGYCPKGRLAEDGTIPLKFNLIETKTDKYPPRTELNVKSSDATIIFNRDSVIERGCALTESLCIKHNKPCLILYGIQETDVKKHVQAIEKFIMKESISILNIAGNRESKAPGINLFVFKVLSELPIELFQKNLTSRL